MAHRLKVPLILVFSCIIFWGCPPVDPAEVAVRSFLEAWSKQKTRRTAKALHENFSFSWEFPAPGDLPSEGSFDKETFLKRMEQLPEREILTGDLRYLFSKNNGVQEFEVFIEMKTPWQGLESARHIAELYGTASLTFKARFRLVMGSEISVLALHLEPVIPTEGWVTPREWEYFQKWIGSSKDSVQIAGKELPELDDLRYFFFYYALFKGKWY
jgi:hypothetical protein